MSPDLLPPSFFLRDPETVARELLGKRLRNGEVVVRITETEAYGGPWDTASHARFGPTGRSGILWGGGGHVYMFICYGIHPMLNFVVGPPDHPGAVLVRAGEPERGLELIQARRPKAKGPALLAGPGRLATGLGLDLSYNGQAAFEPGGLELREGPAPAALLVGPRVGIDYATPEDRDRPWRFAEAGTAWVSAPKGLRPLEAAAG